MKKNGKIKYEEIYNVIRNWKSKKLMKVKKKNKRKEENVEESEIKWNLNESEEEFSETNILKGTREKKERNE